MRLRNKIAIATITALFTLPFNFSTSCQAKSNVSGGEDGASWDVHSQNNTTRSGGFSAVAEPAGPVDPEAAKRAAEKYHFHCVTMPKLVAFFDKTEIDTTDPGTPYPNYTVSHAYEVTGNGYVIKLRTSWKARWRIAGQSQWHQVNGTVTTTETSTPFNLYIADSYGTTP